MHNVAKHDVAIATSNVQIVEKSYFNLLIRLIGLMH